MMLLKIIFCLELNNIKSQETRDFKNQNVNTPTKLLKSIESNASKKNPFSVVTPKKINYTYNF